MAYNLPRRFSITIDGKPVAMPRSNVDERPQATPLEGGGDRPAVFEIEWNHLVSGDYVLGRSMIEPMIIAPKPIIWCHKDNMGQILPVEVEDRGDGPELRFRGKEISFL